MSESTHPAPRTPETKCFLPAKAKATKVCCVVSLSAFFKVDTNPLCCAVLYYKVYLYMYELVFVFFLRIALLYLLLYYHTDYYATSLAGELLLGFT